MAYYCISNKNTILPPHDILFFRATQYYSSKPRNTMLQIEATYLGDAKKYCAKEEKSLFFILNS